VFGGPVQLAYAVPDVRVAAARWIADGVGPFFVLDHIEVRDVRVRGEPGAFDHSSAYAWWGGLMVELIQQHDGGPAPLVGTSGLHHVAFFVDGRDDAATDLVRRGAPELLFATTAGGLSFAFHDARRTHGHLIEIYEPTARITGFYDMVRDASRGWSGDDPIRSP
jgi:hypothetical protein